MRGIHESSSRFNCCVLWVLQVRGTIKTMSEIQSEVPSFHGGLDALEVFTHSYRRKVCAAVKRLIASGHLIKHVGCGKAKYERVFK